MTYKGSWQRLKEITEEQFSNNWDAIFGKRKRKMGCPCKNKTVVNKWMAEVRNRTTNQLLRTYQGDSVLPQLKLRVEEAEGDNPANVIEYKLWSKPTA